LGKAGVPAYAVYSPADPAHPRLLPELLSADALLAALHESAPAPVANP
jgi:thiol:disulfide interchange protein